MFVFVLDGIVTDHVSAVVVVVVVVVRLRPRRFRHRPRERPSRCCCCCCCSSRVHVSPPRVHVSQFGAIEREVALLGALCPFELNPRRRLKLHEKRVELLSPPLKLLNEKSYAQIVRQVRHRRFGDRPEIFGDRPEIRRSSGDADADRAAGAPRRPVIWGLHLAVTVRTSVTRGLNLVLMIIL